MEKGLFRLVINFQLLWLYIRKIIRSQGIKEISRMISVEFPASYGILKWNHMKAGSRLQELKGKDFVAISDAGS